MSGMESFVFLHRKNISTILSRVTCRQTSCHARGVIRAETRQGWVIRQSCDSVSLWHDTAPLPPKILSG